MNAIENKLSLLSVEEVSDIAARMNADMSGEAGVILQAALNVLEVKMAESDFVRFCDKLAA
jgi:uncharacterized protein YcsI (UPF0317 family)